MHLNYSKGSNVFGSEQPSVGPSEAPSAIFGSELGSNYLGNFLRFKYCAIT